MNSLGRFPNEYSAPLGQLLHGFVEHFIKMRKHFILFTMLNKERKIKALDLQMPFS